MNISTICLDDCMPFWCPKVIARVEKVDMLIWTFYIRYLSENL